MNSGWQCICFNRRVMAYAAAAMALSDRGFWLADRDFSTRDLAFEAARAVVSRRCGADGVEPLPVIGDFIIPPPDGAATRDFQTLHFDFGLPLVPTVAQDVARYTALYIASERGGCLGENSAGAARSYVATT